MKKHSYIESGQLWVITGPDDQTPYFLKSSYVWANHGDYDAQQVFVPSESGDGSDAMIASSLESVADQMDAILYGTEAEAIAAFEADGPSMAWQDVAERLFGQDFIAPLSEVLGINRRTVERWRSGAVEISEKIESDIADLARSGRDNRNYGLMLRRAAGGEDPHAILDAANALVEDIRDEKPIATKAARR